MGLKIHTSVSRHFQVVAFETQQPIRGAVGLRNVDLFIAAIRCWLISRIYISVLERNNAQRYRLEAILGGVQENLESLLGQTAIHPTIKVRVKEPGIRMMTLSSANLLP